MANRRATQEQWDKAKALFEADKSFRDIAKEVKIDHSTIGKRAREEGWKRGVLPQLIEDTARVKVEFSTLLPQQQSVVEKEVEDRVKHITFINNATLKNLSIMMKKIDDDTPIADHNVAQQAINKGADRLLGKEPATVINNTNAQQTIVPRTLKDFYGDA